jgi:parallel beta-helix repeat protein
MSHSLPVRSTTFGARAFLAFAVVAFVVVVVPTASATVGTLVITANTVLTEDHQGTVIVAADNVTFDCAGHTVSGPGNGYGDIGIVLDGRTGVVVRNCNVTGFDNGLIVVGFSGPSTNNTLMQNTAYGNLSSGFALNRANATTLSGDTSNDTGDNGFGAYQSYQNVFTGNRASNNQKGFAIELATENRFSDNTATGNRQNGFQILGSDRNTLRANNADGNNGSAVTDEHSVE